MGTRVATQDDLVKLLHMGADMHSESAYSFLPYEPQKFMRTLFNCLSNGIVLVYESGGEIIGMLAAIKSDYFFCYDTLISDLVVYVKPEFRGSWAAPSMVKMLWNWAKKTNARELCLGISTGINEERTGKLLTALGFDYRGSIYKRRI